MLTDEEANSAIDAIALGLDRLITKIYEDEDGILSYCLIFEYNRLREWFDKLYVDIKNTTVVSFHYIEYIGEHLDNTNELLKPLFRKFHIDEILEEI